MLFSERLKGFQAAHPCQSITVDGAQYRYVLAGNEGAQTLVLLNGGMNTLAMWMDYVDDLARDFRVLLFDYPQELRTNQALVTGMHAFFKKLRVEKPVFIVDSDGTYYDGVLTHTVINEASVLHYYLKENLPLDRCFLVTVEGGIPDLSGNETEEFSFKFLSEYRDIVSTEVLLPLDDVSGFWAPDGSGSTSGLTQESNFFVSSNIGVRLDNQKSTKLIYDFDPSFSGGAWQIREYHSTQSITRATNDGVLTFWVYGDGSNNTISTALRVRTGNKNGGIKYNLKPVDFRGWSMISWDLLNDEYEHFTGTDVLAADWRLDSFFFKHKNTDGNPDVPQQAWKGEINIDLLEFTKFDNSAIRTASFDDITGVDAIAAKSGAIKLKAAGGVLTVNSPSAIAHVEVYSVAGMVVLGAAPMTTSATLSLEALPKGVYVVRVSATDGTSATAKFVK